ncbi:pyrimidine reductase family protein [Microbacterium bovistercoris]|uniref:Pyrimidine reductase family protein n=1 Tax=Microbacterium bovistercoris TaxID=2293570 RepID=A0A371NS01_9MICO|nr:pyrimidine reductase family protein [Microbacterium bovistercoris]REJ04977.1 pyrimidine reductase family protein [Microbacterium bovistercoris]
MDLLWPDAAVDLDDEALLALTRMPEGRPWLRMNFISSIDGAATREGRSGGLGDAADRRLFDLLRRPADAVLLGAGTARDEGYGAMRLDAASVAWREERGMPPHPVFVLISRSLRLDPASPIFADAPVRPIVCTVAGAQPGELADVADVIVCGEGDVDPLRVRAELAARGLRRVHGEGGPHVFGSFLSAGAVDALHLTLAPSLEAGAAGRITAGAPASPTGMRLASVLRAADELFLHYVRG